MGDRSKAENADRLEPMAAEAAKDGYVNADEARIIIAFDELTTARHEGDDEAEDAAAKQLADVLADVTGELARLRVIVDAACERHLAFTRYRDDVSEATERAVFAAGAVLNEVVAAEVARRASL